MLRKNKYFIYCLALVVFQQIFLAWSTYFIALAGRALSHNARPEVLHYVVLFFVTALFAYFFNSCAEYLQLKLKNSLWKNYTTNTFHAIQANLQLSSNKNKQLVINWLTGEAPATFDNVATFIVELASTYCNVIFTLIVFCITLGYFMAGAMSVSIFASILLIHFLRGYIAKLADKIQTTKLQTLVSINSLWDSCLYASSDLVYRNYTKLDIKARKYFKNSERYLLVEQFMACLPIYVAIPLVIIMMFYLSGSNNIELGVVVVVLPRSLQLFGNIHSLSMYNSKVLLMRYKLVNLKNFTQGLERQHLTTQIKLSHIAILNTQNNEVLTFDELLNKISHNELNQGRILITGDNGAGKSSLLKLIKEMYPDITILAAPGINFMNYDMNASSGEHQLKQAKFIFSQNASIFLLDEWDANLDQHNTAILNQHIEELAIKLLVIEIRHKILP